MKACPCEWSRWLLGLVLVSLAVMPTTCVAWTLDPEDGPEPPALTE